jgi:hypothetical protein
MRIIAFVTEVGSHKRILEHLGEPTTLPLIASARAPPHREEDFDRAKASKELKELI